MIYNIHECNMGALQKRLTTIKRKCDKYGCEFSFTEIGHHMENTYDDGIYTGSIKIVEIDVQGTAKVNGWEFLGTIEHTPNGNVVRSFNEVPAWAYTVEPKCDHCRTKHFRKDTYLVKNENGEIKQVGKACLKEYTNGLSAEHAASLASVLMECEEKQSFNGLSCTRFYRTETYLAYAAETIKHFGYVSKQKAMEYGGITTSSQASGYMIGPDKYEQEEMKNVGFDAESQKETVKTALEWIAQQEDTSTYIHNLKIACSNEYCETRDFGILASLFASYAKATQKETEKTEKKTSQYVGKVGERIQIEADIKFLTCWENDFGTVNLYNITDENGNIFIWKTSKSIENGRITLKGTVKAHGEYKGIKQTELTRCKIM